LSYKTLWGLFYERQVYLLKLSSKLPRKGETVWLAAPTMLGVEPKLHKATVKEIGFGQNALF